MKLFRKKGPASEQNELAESRSTSKKTATGKLTKAKIKSLDSWLLQPVIFAVVCFGLCYVLLEVLYLKPLDQESQSQLIEHRAKVIESNVSQYLLDQVHWVNSLSYAENLDQAGIYQLLKLTKPELESLHVVPLAQLASLSTDSGFSFASVDLLRRAAKGEKTQVEAFIQDAKWYFQVVIPVTRTNQASGSSDLLLVVFNTDELTKLMQKVRQRYQGQLAVRIEGILKPLMKNGEGVETEEMVLQTAIKAWQISYAPSENDLVSSDRTLLLIVLFGVLGVFIIGFMVIFRANITAIKRDLQHTVQVISKAAESDAKFPNTFKFGEVFSMANAILGQFKQVLAKHKKQPGNLQKAEPKSNVSAMESVDDEPLFDDDLFDIDAVDLPDHSSEQLAPSQQQAVVEEKASLNVDVDSGIFRAYDIRGVVNESLSPAIVTLLGKAIGSEALSQGQRALCVGYDGRLSSPEYAEALVSGIISTGVDAILVGRVPTPVLYFATHHFGTGSGVMITGSHNPSNYNGFKMMIGGHTLSGDAIQKLYKRIEHQDFEQGQGERSTREINRAYIDTIMNDIAVAAPLKVVVDAGNGVAGGLAPELIEELGCEVIPLYCEIDGNFPNHHPDPGKPANLQDLIAAVQEHGADIGLAFDGDGDRLGVVTNTGKIIWPDRLLMLFAKDVVSRNPGADIIYDVKCSRRLNGLISSYGGRPVMWKTGHSLIKAKMKETGALLAGEMSGHVFFKERWYGFDDALYSAARLLEILGVEDKSAEDVFAEFPEDVSTPEINVDVSEERKFEIIDKLCARKEQFTGGNVSTIDGLRVDFPNGWGLCRASNTTPVLVLRFEADDEHALQEIKSKFIRQLKDIDPSLVCDF